MPLSPIGIFHTIAGIVAVISAIALFARHKQIRSGSMLANTYLITTLLTAVSALTIFRHGGPNAAHVLAGLTVAAVVAGFVAERSGLLKGLTKYFVALCYSGSFLFHMLPTATEILTRFPADNPMVSSLTDPLLQKTFGVITLVFLVGLVSQLVWLYKQR